MGDETVAGIGEFGLLARLTARLPQGTHVVLGPGDDAAVLSVADGQVVVSTDLLLENRHFRRDWSSAEDVGCKAAACNLSDINAMGGVGTALLVGLGIPADLPTAWALEFADAIAEEASRVGASVVGGDVSGADTVVIAVTALGTCVHGIVTRSGAQAGDVVAIAGRLGWASAGFAVLSRGFRSPRVVVEAHQRPRPPYDAGPEAARLGAHAMVDVSDGLVADLGHVAVASAVAIDIDSRSFEIDEPLQAVGAAVGVNPLSFVLNGGDDYALAATFASPAQLPDSWRVVGSVYEGDPGVTVDGAAYVGPAGHQHFR